VAYKITDECISCGACEAECKNEAISEGKTIYEIDQKKCTECIGIADSSRCVEVCPIDGCVTIDKKEDKKALLERWKGLHPGEQPAAGSF